MATSYYGNNTATGDGHANEIISAGGGSSTVDSTGTQTYNYSGYIEINSQGGVSNVHAGLPTGGDGQGWYDNVYALAGVTVPGGTWSAKVNIVASAVSATGTLYVRFFELDLLSVTYTQIAVANSGTITVTTSPQEVTLSATGISTYTFGSIGNDAGLYVDLYWDQTSGGSASNLISVGVTNGTSGVPGDSGGLEFILPIGGGTISLTGTEKLILSDSGNFGIDLTGAEKLSLKDSGTLSVVSQVPHIPPPAMPIISQGAPVYTNMTSYTPANADDAHYGTIWRSATVPSGGSPVDLVYDLSHVGALGEIVVELINEIGNYRPAVDGGTSQISSLFQNYTIDANAAAGGPNAQQPFPTYTTYPSTAWVNLVTVTGNDYPTRQHIVNFAGYNWLRFRCTQASNYNINNDVLVQMDVHDAHLGTQDRWLVLGDSWTEEGWVHASINGGDWGTAVPGAVSQVVSSLTYSTYYPAMIAAGDGGWKYSDAVSDLADLLNGFSGGFVIVSYGINDVNQTFAFSAGDSNITGIYGNMETVIDAALALNNVVIVQPVPWAIGNGYVGANAQLYNTYLNANLPTSYPTQYGKSLFIGPDLWTFFDDNQGLIRNQGGVYLHPTYIESTPGVADGYEEIHLLWAEWMNTYIYQVGARPAVFTLADSAIALYTLTDSIAL